MAQGRGGPAEARVRVVPAAVRVRVRVVPAAARIRVVQGRVVPAVARI
jgi:hypothetical protein